MPDYTVGVSSTVTTDLTAFTQDMSVADCGEI